MKNIQLLTIFLFCMNQVSSQNEEFFIPISIFIDDENVQNKSSFKGALENRLMESVSISGLAAINSGRFFITPSVTVLDKRVIQGPPSSYLVELNLSLYSADGETETVFSTVSYIVKGAGKTEDAAYLNALRELKFNNNKFQQFIKETRQRISDYYAKKCESIIASSDALAAEDLPAAITELGLIPMSSEDCFSKAQELIKNFRKAYIRSQCNKKLQEARNIWAAGLDKYSANRAITVLNDVIYSTDCQSGINELMKDIQLKFQSDIAYSRELEEKRRLWTQEQERTRLEQENMRLELEQANRKEIYSLLKTYYKSRPKSIYNTRFLFLR